jgi:mediator of RNA polymerase II transcription subunit 4
MRQTLAEPVQQLEQLSQALLRSLGPASASYKVPAPPPIEAFAQADAALASALHEARLHQVKQLEIERLTEEIVDLDAQLRGIVATLSDGLDELGRIVAEGEETMGTIERASKGALCSFFESMHRLYWRLLIFWLWRPRIKARFRIH